MRFSFLSLYVKNEVSNSQPKLNAHRTLTHQRQNFPFARLDCGIPPPPLPSPSGQRGSRQMNWRSSETIPFECSHSYSVDNGCVGTGLFVVSHSHFLPSPRPLALPTAQVYLALGKAERTTIPCTAIKATIKHNFDVCITRLFRVSRHSHRWIRLNANWVAVVCHTRPKNALLRSMCASSKTVAGC